MGQSAAPGGTPQPGTPSSALASLPPPLGCLLSAAGWGCGQVLPGMRWASLHLTHPRTGPGLALPKKLVGFLLFCHLEVLLTCYSLYTRNN